MVSNTACTCVPVCTTVCVCLALGLGQRAGPLTYTEVMTSPPYIYDSPGQQIYSKEPLEVMLPAPPKYEGMAMLE